MSQRPWAIVANEKWIVWLNMLSPDNREFILAHELFYFDEYVSLRMTPVEILNNVRVRRYTDALSV